MAVKKIKGSEYGLENGTLILDFLFKSKYIHYGFFPDDLEGEFWNLGKAQEEYTKNLLSKLPQEVRTILDVGCGTGMVAKRLVENGYDVECISPSSILTEKVHENAPSVTVYECKFEDFVPNKKYDMVLFCESYQYIKLENLFEKLQECMAQDGFMMLSDMFKTKEKERGPVGGGHFIDKHMKFCKDNGLTNVVDQDITRYIAPTFDILQDVSLNLIKPLMDNTDRIARVNHPLVHKVILWFFRKKLDKFSNKLTRKDRNGAGFKEYNSYRVQVWKRGASGSSLEIERQ